MSFYINLIAPEFFLTLQIFIFPYGRWFLIGRSFKYPPWPFRILLESLAAIKSEGIVLSNPWASLMVNFILYTYKKIIKRPWNLLLWKKWAAWIAGFYCCLEILMGILRSLELPPVPKGTFGRVWFFWFKPKEQLKKSFINICV